MSLKVAWGITGSGDFMPEVIKSVKEIRQENAEIEFYIFLSRAAQQVLRWYNLTSQLGTISDKIFHEVDANKTEPFYYLPGALQLGKFRLFLICPATSNTVAKMVNGIADTLITNAAAQAAKANIPIYVMPVDHDEGVQITTLPDGKQLKLTMRKIDTENTKRLGAMENFHIFTDPSTLREIINSHL